MEPEVRKKAIVIGAALTMFQFLIAGVAYFAWMQANPGAPLGRPYIDIALLDNPLFAGLAIAGIVALFLGSYIGNATQLQMEPFVRFVISFALREFCGLVGFILAFLFQNPHLCLPFVAAAAFSMIRALAAVR